LSYIGKTPTPAPLTANDIADGIITEDKLGANAVTTGKITDGTVAQADISDQAINEAKMQISNAPTNGYFLSAQSGNTGGMTWAEAGGGSWVLVDTQTASGNPSTLEPGAVFSATYDTYVVIIRRINLSDSGGLSLYIGTSGGFVTSGYYFAGSGVSGGANDTYSGSASDIPLLGGTSSAYHCNTTADCLSGVIWFHNPFNSYRTSIHGEMSWENASDVRASINNFSAHPNTNASYDRWKLAPSSGTFQSNTIIQTFGVVNA
jgi:hypothetical protein